MHTVLLLDLWSFAEDFIEMCNKYACSQDLELSVTRSVTLANANCLITAVSNHCYLIAYWFKHDYATTPSSHDTAKLA